VQKLVDTGVPPLSNFSIGILGGNPWSPDGRRLVFARMQPQGSLALWTIDLDSGEETQLTQPSGNEGHGAASWSHDGERLVFSRFTPEGSSIRTLTLKNGNTKEIFGDENANFQATWSPDDRRIVFSSNRGGDVGNLWVMDVDKGQPRALTTGQLDDGSPVVGRNGEIIYSSTSHQTDLYLEELESGEQKRLTQHTQDNFDSQISPDGSEVAYYSSRTGNGEIWILDLASGSERQLTNHEGGDWSPRWSPDGKTILFESDRGGQSEVWEVDASGGIPRKLVRGSSPHWSPDGTMIGYVTRGEGGEELWLANRDGTEARKVLDGVSDYGFYRDARHVIYTPAEEGRSAEMRVRNLDTGEEAVLLVEPHRELEVAPGGRAVSYCSSTSHFNMNLHMVYLDPPATPGGLPTPRGVPEAVTQGRGLWHVHNGSWSPDGKQVIYTRDTDAGDILVMSGAF
jgi:TolB protein